MNDIYEMVLSAMPSKLLKITSLVWNFFGTYCAHVNSSDHAITLGIK